MRDTDDAARTLVLVDVAPGAPRFIGDRQFYVFGASREAVDPIAKSYGVGVKDRTDEAMLDQADGALAEALRAKGWFSRGRLARPRVGGLGDRGQGTSRCACASTPARSSCRASTATSTTTPTCSRLPWRSTPRRTARRPTSPTRSARSTRSAAFSTSRCGSEVRGGDDPVKLLFFHVDEHARVHVVARRYPCLKLEAIKNLSAGGPRSPSRDRHGDRQLPRGRAPRRRPLRRPRSAGRQRHDRRRGQVRWRNGATAVPLDLRSRRARTSRTRTTARSSTCRSSTRTRGSSTPRWGPLGIVRARCDPRGPAGRCVPLPLAAGAARHVRIRSVRPAAADAAADVVADVPARPAHGVECAPTRSSSSSP